MRHLVETIDSIFLEFGGSIRIPRDYNGGENEKVQKLLENLGFYRNRVYQDIQGNEFLWQEPGTNEEIQQTVCTRFKAEFPVFEKIDVNGDNAAPLYKFLKSEKGGFLGNAVKWNFTKFLVDKEGKVVERYAPKTPPLQFEKDIQNLLGVA